jgi:hypothetical protein
VPKVQHKPIKSPRKGSNKNSKIQPKGSPGLAHQTVRCTTGQCPVHQGIQLRTCHLREFREPLRYNSPDCPVHHRTVRCASGVTAIQHQRSSATLQCATARAEVRAGAEGAPDSEQDRSGAPPDCPVAQLSEAPTVGTQRPGDVVGAPDSPVRHTTAASTNGSFGGWGYKYPQPPHFNASKFSAMKPHTRALDFIPRHKQRDQILSQVQRSFQSNSD